MNILKNHFLTQMDYRSFQATRHIKVRLLSQKYQEKTLETKLATPMETEIITREVIRPYERLYEEITSNKTNIINYIDRISG